MSKSQGGSEPGGVAGAPRGSCGWREERGEKWEGGQGGDGGHGRTGLLPQVRWEPWRVVGRGGTCPDSGVHKPPVDAVEGKGESWETRVKACTDPGRGRGEEEVKHGENMLTGSKSAHLTPVKQPLGGVLNTTPR